MTKKTKIINNPDEWIITRKGDFVRIKDELKLVDKKLEIIREHLKKPFQSKIRFKGKTDEQVSKERYDKVWEEVNFDPEKLHNWIYDEKNKDKVEIVKIEGQDFSEAVEVIFNKIKTTKQKWRSWNVKRLSSEVKDNEGTHEQKGLINEETGQIIYSGSFIKDKLNMLTLDGLFNGDRKFVIIGNPTQKIFRDKEGKPANHSSVMIFLHGTYGAVNQFPELEKKFPNTKFIYPKSPVLQYDMWHGSRPAPGEQQRGWINITGDAWELMERDLFKEYNNPHNPPSRKNFEEADKIIHLDYPQLRRAVNHVNNIIEGEIADGISPEKIFISGYSQGGLLTLATALTSQHKLGGFIPLCGLLPCWDKLLVNPSEKNKETPCLIINNSGDSWIPFWTGKKSYELLEERGYNVEFKTRPGRGHGWENEDIEKFLVKCLFQEYFSQKNVSAIEINQKGLLIKYQSGKEESISTNQLTSEQQEIKNYLEANNKKILTREELEISQDYNHNSDNSSNEKRPKTSRLWWILGIVILGLILVVIIIKLIKTFKNQKPKKKKKKKQKTLRNFSQVPKINYITNYKISRGGAVV